MSKKNSPTWVVATDGSVDHLVGLGAWGFHADGATTIAVGPCRSSTAAEAHAVALALAAAPSGCVVQLLLDHQPLALGLRHLVATGRLPRWPVLRRDPELRASFQRIAAFARRRPLAVNWVRGHAQNERNRSVDIAVRAALRQSRAAA
jgi:ribonuclease HI